MSPSESETRGKKRSREASEAKKVFDSVFDIFMDFASKAETIVLKQQQTGRLIAQAQIGVPGDEKKEEHEGFDDVGEAFDKLPPGAKEEVLKEVWGEIAENLMESLPEEGKEAFLVRCFDGLYQKLPEKSRKKVDAKVKGALSSSPRQGPAPEALWSDSEGALDEFPRTFEPDALVEAGKSVRRIPVPAHTSIKKPKTIGRPTQTQTGQTQTDQTQTTQ